MNGEDGAIMAPEEKAREEIDQLLKEAGWAVQDYDQFSLGASLGVAVREFPLISGFADYLLFIDREAVGAIKAKISVNGDIPKTSDLPPRDIRIAFPNRKRNMLCCLA